MIFKAIRDKRRTIMAALGRDALTYERLMQMTQPGYVTWKPKAGVALYWTNSISDKVIEQLVEGNPALKQLDVKKVLARGRDVEWVIPAELAKTLDNIRPEQGEKALVGELVETMQNRWKQWILINPMRVFKYNINNATGDIDIAMAYDPKILTYAKDALSDLRKLAKGTPLSAQAEQEMNDAMKFLVTGSGMTASDIPEISDILSLDKTIQAYSNKKDMNVIKRVWNENKRLTELRENILRLAAYRYFLDRVGQHKAGKRPIDSAASDPSIIADMKNGDPRELAARLARDLMGDYGNLSTTSNWLRRYAIPFWSFQAVNATRYYRLFTNLLYDETLTPEGRVSARKRMGGVLAKKGLTKMALLALKAQVLMLMVNMWNMAMFPDEEKKLSDAQRRQLHLILWTGSDGSIHTLRVQGAFSELLGWLALEAYPSDAKAIIEGKKTVQQQLEESGKAVVNKFVQGVTPLMKAPVEYSAGISFYPDVFGPRPTRDRTQQFLKTFSLDKLWNLAVGKPKKGGSLTQQLIDDALGTVFYTTDPGTAAYYKARELVRNYKKNENIC
jgi:hypothetical protein